MSVIVVAWNAADVIGRCLDHLFAQDYANREIVVVDDGSGDDTFEIAERASERGPLTLVRSKGNRGCPGARNLGLRHAAGEIVAFVDADGFVDRRWMTNIVTAFGDDPTIGGVASTVFYDDNPLVINGAGGTVNRQGWAADLAMNQSYEAAELAATALYPMGCGMAIRREAFERVGPFDDRMLNYYDDVDYGVRLWRAGYRIVVAADAWVDHAAAGRDSARKRLLCERHRMRVVLKHWPIERLAQWAAHEARGLVAAPAAGRSQKLKALAWNLCHLLSAATARRRMRSAERMPERLLDDSWGDGFPTGMAERTTPMPQTARARVVIGDDDSAGQLLHGWFRPEGDGDRGYRWAGSDAALLVSLRRPAVCVRLDYAHAPEDVDGVAVAIRRIGSSDPLEVLWKTRLRWYYIARSLETHPVELPQGDYEVLFRTANAWLEQPLQTRRLGFALAAVAFEDSLEIEPAGLDMAAQSSERQLAGGWFELEQAPEGAYRWSSGYASAIVRAVGGVQGVRLRYRLAPGRTSDLGVSVVPIGSASPAVTWRIAWERDGWREDAFAAVLAPGDYMVSFDVAETWSNVGQEDPSLPPENRALGVALASISLE